MKNGSRQAPHPWVIFLCFVLVPRVCSLLFKLMEPFSFFYTSGISRIPRYVYPTIFPLLTSPHTIICMRALNVRTSGVSATSADLCRLEPLIHQITSIPMGRGSSEPRSSLLFIHIGGGSPMMGHFFSPLSIDESSV